MKKSEVLYAAAEWMQRHGFSPDYIKGECGCFIRACDAVTQDRGFVVSIAMFDVVGASCGNERELVEAGWTDGCTDDAVAALEIAADIAHAEGK